MPGKKDLDERCKDCSHLSTLSEKHGVIWICTRNNDGPFDEVEEEFLCLTYEEETQEMFNKLTKRIISFGKNKPTYLGCGIAGEVGELCNLLKKCERAIFSGDVINELCIAEELADIFIYSILIARMFNIEFVKAIVEKINTIRKRLAEVKRDGSAGNDNG